MTLLQRDDAFIPKDENSPIPSLEVQVLGECNVNNIYASPEPFVDGMRMALSALKVNDISVDAHEVSLAGPLEKIYFTPETTKVGIVTCGGLCPGLNNVIRGLVLNLYNRYHVTQVYGLKYGYEGLVPQLSKVIKLTPESVSDIHQHGGTILGTSRGGHDSNVMAQFLIDNDFNILFAIGGDGTLRGADAINSSLHEKNAKIAVIGIPKTVDNDICYTDATFGFQTAVGLAQDAIRSIHYEAKSVKNGIGIVRLMGRDAGFIALYASVSNGDVNVVIIPEVETSMEDIKKFVEERLKCSGHVVIVVAEGALQNCKPSNVTLGRDKSGNLLHWDAIDFIKTSITNHLNKRNIEHTIKFVDPSYTIRSARCSAADAHFCMCLANAAVHVAMAGITGVVICHHHNNFVNVPISRAIHFVKRVNPQGPLLTMMNSIEQYK
ncbi:6-phosphofructokinase [Entamoeba marina]